MPKLRDIMRPSFLTTAPPDESVSKAVEKMAAGNVGMVAVLEGERLVGLFSERDLLKRIVNAGRDPSAVELREVMTTDIITADVDTDCSVAVALMDSANIRHVPVMEGDRLVAMLSIRDLLRLELENRAEEVRYLQQYLFHGSHPVHA
jgi:CBS domain-containing protein